MQLGMIGLGKMGAGMTRLPSGGHEMVVFARSPGAADAAVLAGSPEDELQRRV